MCTCVLEILPNKSVNCPIALSIDSIVLDKPMFTLVPESVHHLQIDIIYASVICSIALSINSVVSNKPMFTLVP